MLGVRLPESETSPGPACGAAARPGGPARVARRRDRGLWTRWPGLASARCAVVPPPAQWPRHRAAPAARPRRSGPASRRTRGPGRPRSPRGAAPPHSQQSGGLRRSPAVSRWAGSGGHHSWPADRPSSPNIRRTGSASGSPPHMKTRQYDQSMAAAGRRTQPSRSNNPASVLFSRAASTAAPSRSRWNRRTTNSPAAGADGFTVSWLTPPVTVTTRGSPSTKHAEATSPSAGRTSSPVTRTSRSSTRSTQGQSSQPGRSNESWSTRTSGSLTGPAASVPVR
jgi:hypothetical protein